MLKNFWKRMYDIFREMKFRVLILAKVSGEEIFRLFVFFRPAVKSLSELGVLGASFGCARCMNTQPCLDKMETFNPMLRAEQKKEGHCHSLSYLVLHFSKCCGNCDIYLSNTMTYVSLFASFNFEYDIKFWSMFYCTLELLAE